MSEATSELKKDLKNSLSHLQTLRDEVVPAVRRLSAFATLTGSHRAAQLADTTGLLLNNCALAISRRSLAEPPAAETVELLDLALSLKLAPRTRKAIQENRSGLNEARRRLKPAPHRPQRAAAQRSAPQRAAPQRSASQRRAPQRSASRSPSRRGGRSPYRRSSSRRPSSLAALWDMFRAAFVVVCFVCFIWFVPESPRWCIAHGKEERGMDILAKVHANGDHNDELVQLEFVEIRDTLKLEKEVEGNGWLELVKTKGNRRRLIILLSAGLFSQWSGNGLVSYYISKVS